MLEVKLDKVKPGDEVKSTLGLQHRESEQSPGL